MKKILVIGIKGMAGHVVFKSLPKLGNYEVYGVARNVASTDRVFNLDVSNTEELKKIIRQEKIKKIYNKLFARFSVNSFFLKILNELL